MAIDLVDSLYLFEWERLCETLSWPGSFSAMELGVVSRTDAVGRKHDAEPNEFLFHCLSTLPMGLSRAPHSCHCVCARAMVVAAVRISLSSAAARMQLLL